MEVGLGHLRYPPAVFWRLTLREYAAACDGLMERYGGRDAAPGGGLSNAELDDLMAKYPDKI